MQQISKKFNINHGFTIVELLVVIVVIGILAAITIVSYIGISGRATVAVVQSDLTNASKQLKIYQATNDSYPTALNLSNCPTAPIIDNNLCLKSSPGNTFTYTSDGIDFNLIEDNTNGMLYNITNNTSVAIYVDPWAADWYLGIAATVLEGKHVYKTDLVSTYMFKTTNDSITSPQGAIGLDPNYPSRMSLVSPQTNPDVDFLDYPAQSACKAIGGRLPNIQELSAIYADRATYGNNFQQTYRWSATEYTTYAYSWRFFNGTANLFSKATGLLVRCISD